MKSFYIDPNTYDLVLQNNNIRMTTNSIQWLSAKIEARLKTYYGEWFVNRFIGVPYFESILKKQADINNVQAILSDVIKDTRGVSELISFEVDYSSTNRQYTYTFVVKANSNEIIEGGGSL